MITALFITLLLTAGGWFIGKAIPFRSHWRLAPLAVLIGSLVIDLLTYQSSLINFVADCLFTMSLVTMASCLYHFVSGKDVSR